MSNPWDKHLPSLQETVVKAHGLDFVITNDPIAAYGPTDGRARFSYREIKLLQEAGDGAKLPQDLSEVLNRVKRILGGEIERCAIDPRALKG